MEIPQTYVMERLNRWCVYMHWLARSAAFESRPGPKPIRSWWLSIVLAPNVEGEGYASLVKVVVACPVDRDEAQKTTRCVRALAPDLCEVIVQRYIEGGTVQQQIEAISCCLWTYYRRVDSAHVELLGLFNDIEAGVPLPEPAVVDRHVDVEIA